jgi:hypothetical protein
MKTALIFLDEGSIKIVYGNNIKCVRTQDTELAHNLKFFEQIFSTYQVVTVDQVTLLNREAFADWVRELKSPASKQAQPEPMQEARPAPQPQQPQQQPLPSFLEAGAQSILYRSTEETTMIIDDLLTDQEIPGVPGSRRALAIFPYRAVDLASLPKASVQNSVIIKRLIRDGKLVPCTSAEAAQIEVEHLREEAQQRKAEQRELKILDRPVDEFMDGDSAVPGDEDVAKTIRVTGDDRGMEMKGEYNIGELMKMVGAVDDEKDATPPVQRAPRPERPRAVVGDLAAAPIRKAAKKE